MWKSLRFPFVYLNGFTFSKKIFFTSNSFRLNSLFWCFSVFWLCLCLSISYASDLVIWNGYLSKDNQPSSLADWLLALSACTAYLFTAAIKPVQIGGNLPYHDQRRLKAKQKHLNTSMIQIEMPKRNQQLQTSESLIHFGHKHGRQAAMSLRAPSVRVSVSGVLFCFGEVKLRLWLFSFWVYFLGLLKVNSTIKIWFGSHCVS